MSVDTEKIEILLAARDKELVRVIDRNNKKLAQFERQVTKNLTGVSKTVDTHMAKASRAVDRFVKGAVAAVSIQAIRAVTGQVARMVEGVAAIGDEARRSGLGTEAFQELGYVATQSRIPIDALVDGMKELNLRADEWIATGSGPAAEAFGRLGFAAGDLKRRLEDPQELMLEIIDRMEEMDRAAQIRIADEVFGGTGGERFVELLAHGAAGMRDMIGQAHEAGAVLDEDVIAKAAEIDRQFKELTTRIGTYLKTGAVGVAGLLVDAGEALADFKAEIEEVRAAASELNMNDLSAGVRLLGSDARTTLQDDIDLLEESQGAIMRTAAEIEALNAQTDIVARSLLEAAVNARQLGNDELAVALAQLSQEMTALTTAFTKGEVEGDAFIRRLRDLTDRADVARSALAAVDGVEFGGVISRIGDLVSSLGPAIARALELRAALTPGPVRLGPASRSAQISADERMLEPDVLPAPPPPVAPGRPEARPIDIDFGYNPSSGTGGAGGGGGASERASEYQRATDSIERETRALEMEAAALIAVAGFDLDLGDAMDYARKKAELLTAAQEDGRELTPELRAEIDALARAYIDVASEVDTATDALDRMRDNAETGADAMTDLFMAITGGAGDAKQALLQLLLQMGRVSVTNGMTSLAGSGGLVGTLFQALGSSLTPRAAGGPVRAGAPYMVGENGPEPFIPAVDGRILSVQQAQAAYRGEAQGQSSGGAPIYIDARGAQQGVAEQIEEAMRRARPGLIGETVRVVHKKFGTDPGFGRL
ncbi:phage tail tape measure protein [Pseudoroseicyclus sp. H15]